MTFYPVALPSPFSVKVANSARIWKAPVIIAHLVSDDGEWLSKTSRMLSDKWPGVKEDYLRWGEGDFSHPIFSAERFEQGNVLFSHAESGIEVAHIIASSPVVVDGVVIRTLNKEFFTKGLEKTVSRCLEQKSSLSILLDKDIFENHVLDDPEVIKIIISFQEALPEAKVNVCGI